MTQLENMLQSIYPYDQSLIAEFEEHGVGIVDEKLNAAQKIFRSWKRESFSHRADLMKRAGGILRRDKGRLARGFPSPGRGNLYRWV